MLLAKKRTANRMGRCSTGIRGVGGLDGTESRLIWKTKSSFRIAVTYKEIERDNVKGVRERERERCFGIF